MLRGARRRYSLIYVLRAVLGYASGRGGSPPADIHSFHVFRAVPTLPIPSSPNHPQAPSNFLKVGISMQSLPRGAPRGRRQRRRQGVPQGSCGDLWLGRAWPGLGRDRVSDRSRPSAR